jgi:F0F1-type ATP synthase membrane subunit a
MTAIIVYYSIYLTPHLYQSMYWRSGLLPYTAMIVLSVWTFALLTHQATSSTPSTWRMLVTAVVTFLAGGFSEAGGATLTALLLVYVMLCLWFRQKAWAKNSLPFAWVALVSSILAIVVLIAAPTNVYRVGLYGKPTDLLAFPGRLLSFTAGFIRSSLLDTPLPHLAILGTLFLLGFLFFRQNETNIETKKLLLLVLCIGVLTFLFVAATYAPSAYIEKSPPAPRTRIISRFILTFGIGMIAFLVGYYCRQTFHGRWLEVMAIVLLLMAYVYGARSILISSQKISLYAERAAQWDERDALIQQSKVDGMMEVNVRGIDGLPVGGIRDFKENKGVGFWINQCAARYYGVDNIYATLPQE